MMQAARQRGGTVSAETWLLLGICLADAVSSALLFHFGLAEEANPLMRPFAEAGALPLIGVKMAWSSLALAVLEVQARRRPDYVRPKLRLASLLYLGFYALMVGRQFLG